jgi:hypothetical protein
MEASCVTCIPTIQYSDAVNMLADGNATKGPFCQAEVTLIIRSH